MMSMKDIKNNKENPTMQTESRSTGTPSSDTQSNLNNEELNELKRQNKLIVNYLEEIQESQKTREKEQEAITSKLKETTEDFRDNSIKTHNDFVRLLQDNLNKVNTKDIQAELRQDIRKVQDENEEMLREVRASHEHYQKKTKTIIYRDWINAISLYAVCFNYDHRQRLYEFLACRYITKSHSKQN